SRCGRVTRGVQPDLNQTPVDADFTTRVDDALARMNVSQLDVGPAESLQALTEMLGEPAGETRVFYLVSDFRRPQWDQPRDALASLRELHETGARLHLVQCADAQRPNLAITSLHPAGGAQVAGVPLFMEVAVRNYSNQVVRNQSVNLVEDQQPRPA